MINTQLFEGAGIKITAIDPDKDAAVESDWSHHPHYAPHRLDKPFQPFSTFTLKKEYEKAQKKSEESRDRFHFAIRRREDDQLVGFLHLNWISWSNRTASLQIDIPNEELLNAHGDEVLLIAQRLIFCEYNLVRIDFSLPEYEHEMIRLLILHGFQLDIRQRENFYRDGRYWDWLIFGCLVDEWEANPVEATK